MADNSEKLKEAEGKISDDLAEQASYEPGSAEAEQAKERRTRAEEELARARDSGPQHRSKQA